MNKGRKLGPRRYGSGESALMVQELFYSQAKVTILDIMNRTGCCRQTATKLLDTVSIFLPIYQVMDEIPYEFTKRKQGAQTREYSISRRKRC